MERELTAIRRLMEVLLDWSGVVAPAAGRGQLVALLATLPPARWADVDSARWSLLHHAGLGDNAAAIAQLRAHGLSVNAVDDELWTAAHVAAAAVQPRTLEVLCAAGANLLLRDRADQAPLDVALGALPETFPCVRVLLANGVRLRTVSEGCRYLVTPEVVALEHAVVRCRAAVVVLLALKRRRADAMHDMDRWVVREIALACWATRTDVAWN